jgi:N-acetyl-anhydromuramyl-L-alanine amidase AmpD
MSYLSKKQNSCPLLVIEKCNKNKIPHPIEQLHHKKGKFPHTAQPINCFAPYCIGVKEKYPTPYGK